MPFIPHTEEDIAAMLDTIGVSGIDNLFDEIPAALKKKATLEGISPGLNEFEVSRLMQQRAVEDGQPLSFIGAGAYEHFIPAAVWQITARGEYYTAYTPYQAEASQGTLQLLYEYQSMMCALTGMDVSNASLYDGASALAEAVLMAVRANKKAKSKKILMPRTVHPAYRAVTQTLVSGQGIELIEVDFDVNTGVIDPAQLAAYGADSLAAVVIPQTNFFGCIESFDALTDWAHQQEALVIAVANPMALALFKSPNEWGNKGADIVCGDGQPLGAPLSSGGPYFGFICCRNALVRQMPGRIVGLTEDLEGKRGFTLTLQAREQHIRRSKATSNICTNQGLLVTAATIYMAIMGGAGIQQVATHCHHNSRELVAKLQQIPGVQPLFSGPFFHEVVISLPKSAEEVIRQLAMRDISAGYGLADDYPELKNSLLVCATETKTEADLDHFSQQLAEVLAQ
ncbi:MAG TPA: aminomethyl-transferring glycine dehydrogenase subunit GcvPA [Gammaproteobacteria bacterium]|nr:aminomethyl-transferring glycine dehydrogenase subunit GcvPA [Gammaproteobacteria bacterium]